MSDLKSFYSDTGKERVGFVLKDGTVVECKNMFDSENGFDVSAEELIKYGDDAAASWHTHPGTPSNLSVHDRESFLAWPDLQHMVVGKDGISVFAVKFNRVVRVSGPT